MASTSVSESTTRVVGRATESSTAHFFFKKWQISLGNILFWEYSSRRRQNAMQPNQSDSSMDQRHVPRDVYYIWMRAKSNNYPRPLAYPAHYLAWYMIPVTYVTTAKCLLQAPACLLVLHFHRDWAGLMPDIIEVVVSFQLSSVFSNFSLWHSTLHWLLSSNIWVYLGASAMLGSNGSGMCGVPRCRETRRNWLYCHGRLRTDLTYLKLVR